MKRITTYARNERLPLPFHINEQFMSNQQPERQKKASHRDPADVTDFVRQAVEEGTGLHLLKPRYEILQHLLHENISFPSSSGYEPFVDLVKQVVHKYDGPFVIRLPDGQLITNCECTDEQDVLLLAADEDYLPDETQLFFDSSDVSTELVRPPFDFSLSYAQIEGSYRNRLIVVAKCPTKEQKTRIINNMIRLYFYLYDGTESRAQAERNTRLYFEAEDLKPENLVKGNGRSWNNNLVESLCARVCRKLFSDADGQNNDSHDQITRQNALVNYFISQALIRDGLYGHVWTSMFNIFAVVK